MKEIKARSAAGWITVSELSRAVPIHRSTRISLFPSLTEDRKKPMKLVLTLLIAAAVALPVQAADDHKPKHGGVVIETKAGDLELVAKPDIITIHVSDHGKAMKLTSGTGKVTVFNGNEKTEAPLVLVGERLEAKGSFKVAPGAKVLAEVALNGKPAVSARFTLK